MRRHGQYCQPASAIWRPASSLTGDRRPPRALVPWLVHRGSLTRLLHRHFGDGMGLDGKTETWSRPTVNEARLLGISFRHQCLERRVRLHCDGQAMVLARTLVPRSSLVGRNRRLRSLGSRPLGDWLFSDPSVQRETLELARLGPSQQLFPDLPAPAWARRSVFTLSGYPLLIYEVFLDHLTEPRVANPELHRSAA